MQQYSHPPDKEGATNVELPDPAVDLAFLQEFLGEGLDINDALLPANDLFDPVSGDLRYNEPARNGVMRMCAFANLHVGAGTADHPNLPLQSNGFLLGSRLWGRPLSSCTLPGELSTSG